jgi:microsomal epoxide hydrolase
MLANISLYWFTGAIGSSFWPYASACMAPGESRTAST